MKSKLKSNISIILLTLLCSLWAALPAFAATLAGNVDSADAEGIKGFAWNSESMDETVTVEFHIYADGSTMEAKTVTVVADNFDPQLSKAIGDGYHYFKADINWSELTGSTFRIEAYAVSASQERLLLPGVTEYKKSEAAAGSEEASSKTAAKTAAETEAAVETQTAVETTDAKETGKITSLGMFTTTAYCNCTRCSGGSNRTYSGAIPKPNHTISADLDVFPLGTKLMIGNTVYTVEDMGSGVDGRILDIFFGSHAEALAYGMKTVEVFSVES